jgi:predicted acylesterase/phospholipase RssA
MSVVQAPRAGGSRRWARVHALSEPDAALSFLRHHPVDVLVLDTRQYPAVDADGNNPSEQGPFSQTRIGRVLTGLYPPGQFFAGLPRHRVLGVVDSGQHGAEAAFHLGQYRLGSVVTSPTAERLWEHVEGSFELNPTGRVAVCLAGGGIEGLFYELGVLRALDTFLADRSVVDVDLFCGISAGAVIGAYLANGVGPDEIARGLSGGSARIEPIRRTDLFDPNVRELGYRLGRLGRELMQGGRGPRYALSSVARSVPSAAFAGDRLRDYLRRQLQQPGMSDRFDGLRRPLYVGATDQDTSEPVVFGEAGMDHVPVHVATRASTALAPFYAPERIDGRYYTDGAFSRTTNMRVAVRQGATLVILVDPLVPVYSEEPGHVYERGGLYGTAQSLKALVNGRFDKAVTAISEMFPDVSFWLFRPQGEEMRILSGSPMKYFYRREVEDVAYRTTLDKMRGWLPEMTRDFARHGITFRDPEARRPDRKTEPPLEPQALGIEP